jgi:hypothetical protein
VGGVAPTLPAGSKGGAAMTDVKRLWRLTLRAELRTAATPATSVAIGRLASLYDDLELTDESMDVIRRSPRFGLATNRTLPLLLDVLRRRGDLRGLHAAVGQAMQVQPRHRGLRRALAEALTTLRRPEEAFAEWATLVNESSLREEEWAALARLIVRDGVDPTLSAALERQAADAPLEENRPLAQFCVLRARVEHDLPRARAALNLIRPGRIDDPAILLSLAIQAWRLGEWSVSAVAAERALDLGAEPSAAMSVAASAASFSGDPSRLSGELALPEAICEIMDELARHADSRDVVWGELRQVQDGHPEVVTYSCEPGDEAGAEITGCTGVLCTFSVLRRSEVPDPLPLLQSVDWAAPHLMMQRLAGKSHLHAFVPGASDRDWCWHEVLPTLGDRVGGAAKRAATRTDQWTRALSELRDRGEEVR